MTAKRKAGRKTTQGKGLRGRLQVSIIGAGRIGTALGIALNKAGHSLNLIVAKHTASAKRAARLAGGRTLALSVKQTQQPKSDYREQLRESDVIFIATPDDVISSVADELAAWMKFAQTSPHRPVVLHTSGALSSNVLLPLRRLGVSVGALHPLVSISNAQDGAKWLTRAFFSVEGDRSAVRAGKRIVRDLGGRAFTITSDAKPLYHAAALMASPNLTALVDIALEMLGHCGLTANQARKVLLPLIQSTIDNLAVADPIHALTGTFKRGDVATVIKHVEAISAEELFDALETYVVLGRRSVKLAHRDPIFGTEIEQILALAARRARDRS